MRRVWRVVVAISFLGAAVAAPVCGAQRDTVQLKAEWTALLERGADTLAGRQFAAHLREYIEQEANWRVVLPSFEGVSDVEAKGGALRLITWAVPTPAREWLHMGLIVKPQRGGGALCVPLKDRQIPVGNGLVEEGWLTAQGDADSWVGAVYFDAKAFAYQRDTAYLLIGVAGFNAFVARRVVETLYVAADGTVRFGLPVIAQGQKRLGRIMMSHSARVGMEINFVEGKNQVLIDHLSPASGEYVGMPSHYGPDFSYDALELTKGGIWVYSTEVDPQTFNKAVKRKPGQNARLGKGDKSMGSYSPNWK